MADDLDLDAMLDSALDEEFPAPNMTAKTDGGEYCELDLDAMLDEAIETSLETTGDVQPHQAVVCSAADTPSGVSKGRASSDFGPSQDWLQRKQGRGNGAGSLGGKGPQEPFSFLRPERREAWKVAFAEDAQRQGDMDKQRPLSRAYRSFYSTGKGEGDVVVHLGSAASAKGKAGAVKGDESRGADGDEASGTMGEIFDDVLGKGVANSGVKQPPESTEEDSETLERLKVSYLALVAKDVRTRLSKDPDVSAERFPGIVSKILA